MRLSTYPLLLVGASLAIQAGAAPLRVIVVTSHQEVSPIVRPGGHHDAPPVAHIMHEEVPAKGSQRGAGRHLCNKMKDKMSSWASFIFGFPEHDHHGNGAMNMSHTESGHGGFHAVTVDPIGTPVKIDAEAHKSHEQPAGLEALTPMSAVAYKHLEHGHGPVRVHGGMHDRARGPFLRRIFFALHHLGPWEGRAMAFVFGCGIGVLLRMIWVLAVVTVRTIKSRSTTETPIALDEDAQEIIFEAPPHYVIDEKIAVAVADSKAVSTN